MPIDFATLILGSLLTITSILFGLFGVMLVQYEQNRSSIGKKWKAYRLLVIFLSVFIILGFIASLLAFDYLWETSNRVLGFPRTSMLNFIVILFVVEMIIPIATIIAFGIRYIRLG